MEHVQVINAHLNLEGHRVCALGDPQSAQDAATKAYVDAAVAELRAMLAELAPKKK
jgi:hypothetical protein